MKLFKSLLITASVVIFGGMFFMTPVSAQAVPAPASQLAVCGSGLNNFFGIQPWYACLQQKYDGRTHIGSLSDLFLIIFPIVESLVKIGALVAAFIIFFLLIQIMVARGNAGKIATATTGIRDAVIGFIICLVSIAVVNFVSGAFPG